MGEALLRLFSFLLSVTFPPCDCRERLSQSVLIASDAVDTRISSQSSQHATVTQLFSLMCIIIIIGWRSLDVTQAFLGV